MCNIDRNNALLLTTAAMSAWKSGIRYGRENMTGKLCLDGKWTCCMVYLSEDTSERKCALQETRQR